eukprot:Em0020g153a
MDFVRRQLSNLYHWGWRFVGLEQTREEELVWAKIQDRMMLPESADKVDADCTSLALSRSATPSSVSPSIKSTGRYNATHTNKIKPDILPLIASGITQYNPHHQYPSSPVHPHHQYTSHSTPHHQYTLITSTPHHQYHPHHQYTLITSTPHHQYNPHHQYTLITSTLITSTPSSPVHLITSTPSPPVHLHHQTPSSPVHPHHQYTSSPYTLITSTPHHQYTLITSTSSPAPSSPVHPHHQYTLITSTPHHQYTLITSTPSSPDTLITSTPSSPDTLITQYTSSQYKHLTTSTPITRHPHHQYTLITSTLITSTPHHQYTLITSNPHHQYTLITSNLHHQYPHHSTPSSPVHLITSTPHHQYPHHQYTLITSTPSSPVPSPPVHLHHQYNHHHTVHTMSVLFLLGLVQFLMHTVKYPHKKLLGVVLLSPHVLDGVSSDHLFELGGHSSLVPSCPEALEQERQVLGHLPAQIAGLFARAQGLGEVSFVLVGDEILDEAVRVAQALQHGVHETGVPVVLYPRWSREVRSFGLDCLDGRELEWALPAPTRLSSGGDCTSSSSPPFISAPMRCALLCL